MWYEFFIYGLLLSGPVWVWQNKSKGLIGSMPLWMSGGIASILLSFYGISIFIALILSFVIDGFAGILDILCILIGVIIGGAVLPYFVKHLLFILYPIGVILLLEAMSLL